MDVDLLIAIFGGANDGVNFSIAIKIGELCIFDFPDIQSDTDVGPVPILQNIGRPRILIQRRLTGFFPSDNQVYVTISVDIISIDTVGPFKCVVNCMHGPVRRSVRL